MKIKALLTLASAVAFSLSAFAAPADETPLSKEMSTINKSLRTIKRQVADPSKKDENLALLGKVKAAIDNSHKLEPKKTKDQTDKAAYTAKYKDEMVTLGKAIGELEEAIKIDSKDNADKALKHIYEIKDKGHKDFGVDDD